MDRRPDVQRNLELSGSTALTAFLDGSADVGSFSRCIGSCDERTLCDAVPCRLRAAGAALDSAPL